MPTPLEIYEGLKEEKSKYIQIVIKKVLDKTIPFARRYKLKEEDAEDATQDAVTQLLGIIENDEFEFRDICPSQLGIKIAKGFLLNVARNRYNIRKENVAPEDLELFDNKDIQKDFETVEDVRKLKRLISQLGEKCQTLINLRFFQELEPKEIFEKNLTNHPSVEAVSAALSRCKTQLIDLAQAHNIYFNREI